MKRIVLTLLLVLCYSSAWTAQTTLNEGIDDTLDPALTNSGKDVRLTNQANFAKQNLMNTELYNKDAAQDVEIAVNTAKVGITNQQANDIITNLAKVGITPQQAANIIINLEKVGITQEQTDAIIANTAKVSNVTQVLSIDSDQLTLSNGGGTITIPAGSGGSALTVQEEGTPLDAAVTVLNFIGAGITAVENADHTIDITVAAGSAPIDTIFGRTGTVVAVSGDYNADQIDDSGTVNKFATAAELAQIATNDSEIGSNYSQIGANTGNISTNTSNINSHTIDINNPHSTTAAMLGLGNVDNTSDAAKPVSTATQTALDGKQDKLAEGAFVDGDKTKLDGIESGATADQDLSNYIQDSDTFSINLKGDHSNLLFNDGVNFSTLFQPVDLDLTTIAGLACSSGQIMKWNGSAWACAADIGGTAEITEVATDPTAASASGLYWNSVSHSFLYKDDNGLSEYDVTTYTADPVYYTLTVTDPGNNNVIAGSDSDLSTAIDCGDGATDCTAQVLSGATITGHTGTAATGYEFTTWTGADTSTENPASTGFTMLGNLTLGATFGVTAAAYCTGSELFCYDGTSNGQITWDGTVGLTSESCGVYDSDGDWCDYDTTVPSGTGYADIHSFVVRGVDDAQYAYIDISSAVSEFYVEGWVYLSDPGSSIILPIYDTTGTTEQISMMARFNATIRVYSGEAGDYSDSVNTISADTWYHYGLYINQETGGAGGANDGIVRLWINTDGGEFDAADVWINDTALNTEGLTAQEVRFVGPKASDETYKTLTKILSGEPTWVY